MEKLHIQARPGGATDRDGFDDDLAEEDGVGSEGEIQVLTEEEEDEVPVRLPGVATLRAAFASLDVVNLTEEFDQRAS